MSPGIDGNHHDPLNMGNESFWRTYCAHSTPSDQAPSTPPDDAAMRRELQRIGMLCSQDIEACLPPTQSTESLVGAPFSTFDIVRLLGSRFDDAEYHPFPSEHAPLIGGQSDRLRHTSESVSIPEALACLRSSRLITTVSAVVSFVLVTREFFGDMWQKIRSGGLTEEQERQEREFNTTDE